MIFLGKPLCTIETPWRWVGVGVTPGQKARCSFYYEEQSYLLLVSLQSANHICNVAKEDIMDHNNDKEYVSCFTKTKKDKATAL